ncbi:hypothetical protein [Neorhizobium alkalisoli]|uniref:Secreted protein n=1 Tax=Neorhizobium alkalisoli TaxID=528178 RepID=A0A561R7F7_9HYPH|nr:hypothetical protein [Neorhizobium alkalisoli]TWF58554.1 hypothetical protein FHW37_101358 [Neorhizobium alkalisoli]
MVRVIPVALAFVFCSALQALAAQGDDPDWPCIQRKVPELSIGQIWTGPDLPPEASDWSKDEIISGLVDNLAARRLPLAQAQERIRTYRDGLPEAQKNLHVAMLVQGLFDKMNGERSHVISGIARYAHSQRDMAALLRREASDVDALRSKPEANANEVAIRTERLTFQTRIFQERVQSLSFVCEVPTLIEQRLYALVKTLAEAPPAK